MATEHRSPHRSTRDRPAKAPLSERAVIDAGIAVLRAEGLDAVTMRRVAKELDTGAASLYVYVRGRDDLLRLLFDEVAAGVPVPEVDPARWREQLLEFCLALLEALEAHPGIALVALAQVPSGPNAMARTEALLAVLLAGGVEPQAAAWALDAIALLVTATAVETVVGQERQAVDGEVPYDKEKLHRMFSELPADRFPNLVANADVVVNGGARERFVFAINTFVDGLVR